MALIPPGMDLATEKNYKVFLYPSENFKKTEWQSGYDHFDSNVMKKYIDLIKRKVNKGEYLINY